jgi:ABC-2 type transport system permease protein
MVVEHAPAMDSLLWIPARAVLGDGAALLATLAIGLLLLAIPMFLLSRRLGDYALAAAGVVHGDQTQRGATWSFARVGARSMLRR